MTPEEIREGFKDIDHLEVLIDAIVSGKLSEAALKYMDLLDGKVVDGKHLVATDEADDPSPYAQRRAEFWSGDEPR